MLSPPFAVLCTSLMALSPPAIVFSKELKQYSADVFATCLILIALLEYMRHRDLERYVRLLLGFSVMLTLSYTGIVFLPLVLFAVRFGAIPGPLQGLRA